MDRCPEETIDKWKKKGNVRSILDITSWNIDVLPNIPDEVEWLDLSGTMVAEITKLPKNLKWLKCQKMPNLKSFPSAFPEGLRFIDCRWCNILEPQQFPNHVTKVRSHFKQDIEEKYFNETPKEQILQERIAEIQNTPKKTLDISNLGLNKFPKLPDKIKRLKCYGNKFVSMPNLPRDLKILDCSYTDITHFENMPKGLLKIDCSYTMLKSFENLPDSVQKIIAVKCIVSKRINYLPKGLKTLILEDAPIKSIKYFPPNIETIILSELKLKYIPTLPNTVKRLQAILLYKLKGLINLPDSLEELDIDGCLRKFKSLPPLPDGLKVLKINSLKMLDDNYLPNSIEELETEELVLSM